ncbi:MAG: hypothetical protein Q9209_005575 [Squamulea sp. 1 TL-2023]
MLSAVIASASGWNASNPHQDPPALPPRQPPSTASTPPFLQQSASHDASVQQNKLPGPPSMASPAHQVARSSYNPNNYGPMPGARHSPINTTWNQSSTSIFQGVETAATQPQRLPPAPPPKIHDRDEGFLGQQDEFQSVWPQKSDGPSSTNGWVPGLEARPPNNSSNEPRPDLQIIKKATNQDHAGDAFVFPQSTGDHQHDSYYVSNHLRRKDTTESDWSLQPGNSPITSGLSASEAWKADDMSRRREDPSTNVVYDANDHFAPATRGQNIRIVNGIIGGGDCEDLGSDNYGKHVILQLPDGRNRSSQTHSASLGQEVVAPSGYREVNLPGNSSGQAQRDDSFYWHSPQTSASTSHDRDQDPDVPATSSLLDATPEPQEQNISAPPEEASIASNPERTASPIKSTLGSYSASALGFGGPSDWEHFGDYDGVEVDDTDLYLRSKSPAKQTLSAPELPANPVPVDIQIHQSSEIREESSKAISSVQLESTAYVPHDENQKDESLHEVIDGRSKEEDVVQAKQRGVPKQLDPGQPVPSDNTPLKEQQQQKSTSDTTPKPPKLKFEQVQQELEPELGPGSFQEHNLAETMNASFQPQPASSSTMRESEVEIGAQDNPPLESTTGDNSIPAAKAFSPSGNQTSDDIGRPLDKDAVSTRPEYLHQSRQNNVEPIPDSQDSSGEDSIKRASLLSDGSVLSKAKESSVLYHDLDPWARACLNRYVAMLHEEARASTDPERLNIFKAFSKKEWRLRAVLYGADDKSEDGLFTAWKDGPIKRANTLDFRRPAFKALPALPPDADRPESEEMQGHPLASPKLPASPFGKLMTTYIHAPGEDSYTAMESPTDRMEQNADEESTESYSSGGRPIRPQVRRARKSVARSLPDINKHDTGHSTAINDSKPIYTPFRYSQGYVDDADQPVDRRGSFRPYAALKLEPVNYHTETAPEPISEDFHPTNLPPSANNRQSEDIAASTEQVTSSKQRSLETNTAWLLLTDQEQSPDLRRFERADFDPLIAVLPPSSGHIPQSAIELASFHRGIEAVPDDFSFIHQHVVAWDTKAKKIRGENEMERQIRQTESEQRIDALFNDDEIGYGDISELEEESKRAEATRKTSEDRAEYSTFVEEVFNVVWTRLHFEIDQLTPTYDEYASLAHDTLAGKDMFEAKEGQYALAPTMSALLTLHQKLEIRHQKAFEAVLERDRRLKKTEVGPWYTLGDVSKVKQLEKQFDHAEKKAIVDYCKQRDARANRLMDVLDQNTLRGVGANQDYMQAVMKAVRRIASGRAFTSTPANEPGLGMDEVIKAKTVTTVLANSSEQIVQTFHVADMLLNAADYELSVATARLANADSTTLERLKDERAAEDAKLMRDLQHRLALIREDSRRTNDEIVKLLCFLGVQGGHAQAGKMPHVPLHADAEHAQRLQKALEDAKRRNAQKGAENNATP